MSHRYIPLTEQDKNEMLNSIGAKSISELFDDIPTDILLKRNLNIAESEAETILLRRLNRLAAKNTTKETHATFLGAGVYDHYTPAVVDAMISRSEFYTAYTPYQPEISQGELQAIFEFQTLICELTDMDVANSSMYDGMTSFAEACILALSHTKKNKIVVSSGLHYQALQILHTYAKTRDEFEIIEVDLKGTITDLEKLEQLIDDNTAAVAVQYPNFYGSIEDLEQINNYIKDKKSFIYRICQSTFFRITNTPRYIRGRHSSGRYTAFWYSYTIWGSALWILCYNKEINEKSTWSISWANSR